jgi:putative ABC transport system substrate-binding protein
MDSARGQEYLVARERSVSTCRRQALLAGAGLLAAAALARAQPAGQSVHRMGTLSALSWDAIPRPRRAFAARLAELGHVEGRNFTEDVRHAAGNMDALPELARKLIATRPDVIFARANQATLSAKRATSTIPIVFAAVADPVELGVVASLAAPGGNATGVAWDTVRLSQKRLELLREAVPAAKRLAVLHNPGNEMEQRVLVKLRQAAQALDFQVHVVEARVSGDFAAAFRSIEQLRPDALYVIENPISIRARSDIAEFARRARVPAMYGVIDFAEAGGLLAYAADLVAHFRLAADYVHQVLLGAKPAELPVGQPTQFELVVNLKTARAIDLTIPAGVLLRADRVIE